MFAIDARADWVLILDHGPRVRRELLQAQADAFAFQVIVEDLDFDHFFD